MPQVRVNVHTKVRNADIRREKRNGRDYLIVPSATLPDGIIMNGGLYPAEEIERSYMTLERTPAPLGHPQNGDGSYISASDPVAINEYWVGAYNENVRREGGRVYLDKAIDVEVAERTEKGRALMEAINKGEPIHTSTGLVLEQEEAEGDGYGWIARNMVFDHDAILLGDIGAATPEQGVGMMVNAQDPENPLPVLNFSLEECAEHDVEFAAMGLARAIVDMDTARAMDSIKDRIMGAVRGLMGGSREGDENEADGFSVNHQEGNQMPITEEQLKALQDKVDQLSANAEGLKDTVSEAVGEAVKPLSEKLETLEANAQKREDAQREALVNAVVEAGLLDEEEAKEVPLSALNKLAAKAKPGSAHNIFGAHNQGGANEDELSDELPE